MTNLSFSLLAEYNEKPECKQDKNISNVITVIAITSGFVFAIINAVIVYMIVRHKDLHKTIFIYICNAAIANVLSGLLLAWIFGLQKIVLLIRPPRLNLIQNTLFTVTVAASLFNQLGIAIHRYYIIKRKKIGQGWGGNNLNTWTKCGVIMTWAIPLLSFFLPVNTTWNCLKDCKCYQNNNDIGTYYMFCDPLEHCSLTFPPCTRTSVLYVGLFLVILPIISCALYIEIFKMVNQSRKNCRTINLPYSISANLKVRNSPNHFSRKSFAPNNTKKYRLDDSQQASFSGEPPISTSLNNRLSSSHRSASTQIFSEHRNNKKGGRAMTMDTFSLKDESIPPILVSISSAPELKQKQKSCSDFMKLFNIVMSKQSSMSQKEISLLRTLALTLCCYTVSTVPLGALFLASYNETNKKYVTSLKAFIILWLINTLANTVIYLWGFNEIKLKFKTLFVCKKYKTPPHFQIS